MVHLSEEIPEFVTLNGRRTAFVDLPLGTQNALRKSIEKNSLSSKLVTVKAGSNIQAINAELNAIGRTDPRRASKLRTQLIEQGVKGTGLFLGGASPEVIKQLEASRDQQNFADSKANIQQQIDILQDEGRVSANANTSNVPKSVARARAQEIFRKEQGATLFVSQQVRDTLDSPEFAQIKAEGGSRAELNELLNARNVTFPSSARDIINELAQAEIQGEAETANNIQNILRRQGVDTNVNVSLDDSPLGASFSSSNTTAPLIQKVTEIIGGTSNTDGITTFSPDELSLLDFQGLGGSSPFATSIPEIGSTGGGIRGIVSGLGEVANDLLGTNFNPLLVGLAMIFIPIIILLAVFA